MIRLVHLVVVCLLVVAAIHVYQIKFESTVQVERLAKIRAEIKRERNQIAALRSEWSRLDSPGRIQELAERHTKLKPALPVQFGNLDNLPERPARIVPLDAADPIAVMIENIEEDPPTSSVPDRGAR